MIKLDRFNIALIESMSDYSIRSMRTELEINDQNYTGKLSNSIAKTVKKIGKGAKAEIHVSAVGTGESKAYGLEIDAGYSASRAKERLSEIGYQSYFDQLKEWWEEKKGVDPEFSGVLAASTLKSHLKQGYKSRKSNRNGFIEVSINRTEKIAQDLADRQLDLFIELLFEELSTLMNTNKNVKLTINTLGGGLGRITNIVF